MATKYFTLTNVSPADCREHAIYVSWVSMRTRCWNPNTAAYPNYGGRGITICERWREFENYFADMAPSWRKGLSLDRLDNDQNYGPENCRWATRQQKNVNRRPSKWSRWLELAKQHGISREQFQGRINKRGWIPFVAATRPVRPWKPVEHHG